MKLKVNNVSHDIVNYVIPTHKLKFGTERKAVLIGDLHGYHNNKKKLQFLFYSLFFYHKKANCIVGKY